MLGTVVRKAKAEFRRRMVVTDSAELASEWADQLGSGVEVGWDGLGTRFDFFKMSDSYKAPMKTFPNMLLDLRGSFNASDLARLIPSVRGGGIILVLTPNFEEWAQAELSYHRRLASEPYSSGDCRHIFIPRIIRKFYEHEGIWIHRNGRWEKESLEEFEAPPARRLRVPESELPEEIYKLLLSPDQMRGMRELEKGGPVVLRGPAGRGKSALMGLFASALRGMRGRKTEVVVTSSGRPGVVFESIERGLRELRIPFEYKHGLLLGKRIKVSSLKPQEAAEQDADLHLVDDAGRISDAVLKELLKKRSVFSETTEGYGACAANLDVESVVEMTWPVRYSPDDPIEAWLNDTLLLDVRADSSVEGNRFERPTPREVFSDETMLREVYGILSAGEPNNPDTLMALADAPHHFLQITESDGRVAGAIHYALEGGTEISGDSPGNLIPGVLSSRYDLKFSPLKGARVIRMAISGSCGLQELENLEVDWLGSSVKTSQPLEPWISNGYSPVSMSTRASNGVYSVVLVKPLTPVAEGMCSIARGQFFLFFTAALSGVYRDIPAGVATDILRGLSGKVPDFDKYERKRLSLFASGEHTFEVDVDVVRKLARAYFAGKKPFLGTEFEEVLVGALQEPVGLDYDLLREAVGEVHRHLF